MSIFPQGIEVFNGGLSWNLDPRDVQGDIKPWKVLQICDFVGTNDDTSAVLPLNTDLGATGEGLRTLSLGKKHLV